MRTTTGGLSLLLALAACAPEPEASLFYRADQLMQKRADDVEGWKLKWFFAAKGEKVFWTHDVAAADSLVVNPAFEDGQPAAYVLTEFWYRWPNPWDQPVYEMVSPGEGGPMPDGNNPVFGVGVDSTFYSPYWHVQWTQVPGGGASGSDPYRGVREILDDQLTLTDGPNVLCPLIAAGTSLSRPDATLPATHPFTGRALREHDTRRGWVDHHETSYFDADGNAFNASATGRVSEGKLYRFIDPADNAEEAEPLALPPVLPHLSKNVSLFREYRVTLPKFATAFDLPGDATPNLAPTRTPAAMGVVVDPNITADMAKAYRGRVAIDGRTCFSDASKFPGSCTWLDSSTAVEALPSGSITQTQTLVTLPTLLVGDSEP